jgi:hypothetical protein
MHQLDVKKTILDNSRPISWHLARGIYSRMEQGKIIIVTDRPGSLLSATRKQWHRLIRQLQRERSSILGGFRAEQLLCHLALMQDLTFTAKPPEDLLEADVTFASADDFIKAPPTCYSAYIACRVAKEKQHMLTSWMPPHGVVVIYDQDY